MTKTLDKGSANRSRLRFKHSRDYVRAIVDTVREPLMVLSGDYHVKMVNKSFCRTFQVTPGETHNQPLDSLGNGQWKIPQLRTLLDEVISKNAEFHDFEVDHNFPDIGFRAMLINARRLDVIGTTQPLILLAIEDVTIRRQAEQAMTAQNASLENTSLIDDMTGLYNRRGFSILGRRFMDIAHQQGKGIFIAFMDLDGLKRINDEGGHSKGDDALKTASEILKVTFRKTDIIARLGGDEFAVITMGHGRDSVSRLITRLQAHIKLHTVLDYDRQPISMSIGVAHSDPRGRCTLEELTTRADTLMYIEKRSKPHVPAVVAELLAGAA